MSNFNTNVTDKELVLNGYVIPKGCVFQQDRRTGERIYMGEGDKYLYYNPTTDKARWTYPTDTQRNRINTRWKKANYTPLGKISKLHTEQLMKAEWLYRKPTHEWHPERKRKLAPVLV